MYTLDNDYGCTRRDGVSDMTETNGTLTEQMDKAGIHYERTPLNMGTVTAEPAYLVHYTSSKSNAPMTVLVVPQAGADSWAEDYYYFPGLLPEQAQEMDWYAVYEHVKSVAWSTVRKNIHAPSPCPNCGKLDINNADRYTDLRGRVRCSFCHALRETNP